ncbi:MAG: long-chain fatty acid--CoA ligase [Verrucomicrobia bacterium]|nr:long-chain fatty acid--CoA ligase [Verrucomicrobiota bacterium]
MSLLSRFPSYSAKPALAGAWGVVTYGELEGLIAKARHALTQLKLDRPTVFGLIGEHGPASTAWLLACAEAGHFVAPLAGNAAEHPAKLALINAQWIVAAEALEWKLLPRVDEPSAHPLFQQLRDQGSPGLILFSSGTSGTPKAMVQDFGKLLASYESRHESDLAMLALLGFDHIGGLNTLFNTLAAGSLLAVPASRSPADVAATIARHHVAILPASPTFLNLLLAAGVTADLASLRVITYGTEPMPESLLARLKVAFPRVRFIQTFGTSETGITRTASPEAGSTFLRFEDPDLEWKVIDDELWLRSRTQIAGYLNASNERFTADGWFRTGDLGRWDEDGFLWIDGRSKDLIISGGENIHPAELENVLADCPAIAESAVIGIEDAKWGESACAVIVRQAGAQLDEAGVLALFKDRLARYKHPRRVVFFEALPKNAMGKVQKNLLRDLYRDCLKG